MPIDSFLFSALISELETEKNSIEKKLEAQRLAKEKEEQAEKEKHIFDYDDITTRIAKNLQNSEMDRIFDSDYFSNPEERANHEFQMRKAKERNDKRRKEALQDLSDQTDWIRKLTQDAKWERKQDELFSDIEIEESSTSEKKRKI